GAIERAGNMPGHAVDGLDLATEPLRRARIDQRPALRGHPRRHHRGAGDAAHVETSAILTRFRVRRPAAFRTPTGLDPGLYAAVEQRDLLVSEQAEHPPQARGQTAVAAVVDDYRLLGRQAPTRQGLSEAGCARQGVTATTDDAQVGQVLVQVSVDRSRQVRGDVSLAARSGVAQIEAAIDQPQRPIAQLRGQAFHGYQRLLTHSALPSIRSRRLTSIAAVAPQMR